jgi:hypothetical protein
LSRGETINGLSVELPTLGQRDCQGVVDEIKLAAHA